MLLARRGATSIEYALIAAGIALAILMAVFMLGADVENLFTGVTRQLQTKMP